MNLSSLISHLSLLFTLHSSLFTHLPSLISHLFNNDPALRNSLIVME